MANATYLLAVNFSIGLAFSLAFVSIARSQRVTMGYWFAAGFLSASSTAGVETLAPATSAPALVSFLSFSGLLTALTMVTVGLFRNFTTWSVWPILALYLGFEAAFPAVLRGAARDSAIHAFAYQTPFATMTALGGVALLSGSMSRRSVPERLLAGVLFLTSAQFLFKAFLAHAIGTGASVQTYAFSSYAQYSQTISAILSILLGVCLMMVLMEESQSRARHTLLRDHLSGLWTRRAFFEHAEAALKRKTGGGTPVVILCDLDHFKKINDTYGHAVGDEVIRVFAACLEAAGGDVCGRLGGEEFAALTVNGDASLAQLQVEAVRSRLYNAAFGQPGLRPTASFGIAIMDPDESLAEAINRADAALYEAKARGRNRFVFSRNEKDIAVVLREALLRR
ncbi:GGDEF domain-containing protein [Rhizobium sp. C4]|uniref:GGDEF domain-containing protein n=1 Tax=Rhizobium sp. C4 TaxID=1349800 RepID=UPI001E4CB15F|nr:GGDEF domain-containing protein [Rhizobium sp. C4]MCD2174586.1 GGDEF domain-containing protein [Rhizobium sp. C4]